VKRLDTKALRRSITTVIASGMIVLASVTVLLTGILQQQRQENREDVYAHQLHQSIDHAIKHHIREYQYRVRGLVETTPLAQLLKEKNREGLYNILKPKWELMQEQNPNLTAMQIHLSDGRSFLRIHQPEKFDDPIADVRPMLQQIHRDHQFVSGYETGKYATVYRVIAPIFDADHAYIGALELGINPNFIIDAVSDMSGFYGAVFIKDEDLKLFKHPGDLVIDGYRLQSKIPPRLKAIFDATEPPKSLEDHVYIEAGGKQYLSHLYVLKDFLQEPKVKIIFFQDLSQTDVFSSYLLVTFLGVSLLLFIVILFFIYRRITLYEESVTRVYQIQIEKLNESEQRFSLLFEKAPIAYQSLDSDGHLLIINTKWEEELGYSKNEVIGKHFSEFLTQEYKEKFKAHFQTFKSARAINDAQFDMIKKDGTLITVSFNGKVVFDEGDHFLQTHCTFSNITDKIALEKTLRFNDIYLQSVFNATPNIMITTDGEMIDKANSAMLDFFGYDTLEAFHLNHECICDFFIEEDDFLGSEVNDLHWLEYILLMPDKVHKVCMKKEGVNHHFILKAQSLEVDEKHRSVVVFTDVTQIEKLSEQLELAISGTNDGLWDWDLLTNEIYFSAQWKKMLGYEADELENKLETWLALVHPDDKEAAMKDYTANMNGETPFYENVHRLHHKDGSWVWILDRGQTKFDEHNKAVRMVGFHTDITRQKELESQLRSSQELFERFMENIPANVAIKDSDNQIIYANEKAAHFFHKESLLGLNGFDLLAQEYAQQMQELNEQAMHEGAAEDVFEIEYEKRAYIFRVMTFAIGEDVNNIQTGSMYFDITEQYKNQHEIAKFKQIIQKSPVSIVITDVDGNIEYVNPWFTQVTGYTLEEAIGENPRILKSDYHDQEDYVELWDNIVHDKVWNGVFKNIKKDGDEYWESAIIAPIHNEEGVITHFIGIKQEITEEIYLREALKDQEELMIAQSRHAAMGEMISMIAHQWRQPISVIAMGANNILVDIELDEFKIESLKEQLESMLSQTEYLSQTIDDFRNFFRPNKDREEINVEDILNEAQKIIGKSLENNDISLNIHCENTFSVKTYSRELLQVFINLIKNAKEAIVEKRNEGGLIDVLVRGDDTNVVVMFCDNGGGVDAKNLDKIFDPYFSTKDEKTGTGLGLYMSKIIIEKHIHGSIEVSNAKEGACFKVSIPIVYKG
jgi:PAS domain S-box-containing protein